MEQIFQKKPQHPNFDLAVTTGTPQIQIFKSLPQTSPNEKNSFLLNWLNSSPAESTNPLSPHSPDHLRWLLKCHKLQQLPLEHQQAYWPELLELEYPAQMEQERPVISDSDYKSQIMEEAEVEAILLGKEKKLTLPQIQTLEMGAEGAEEAEEGEILETLEECHDHASQGIGLYLLLTVSFLSVPPPRPFRNGLS